MSTPVISQADQEGSLRRVHSLCDIPRQPESVHIRTALRESEGTSGYLPLSSPDRDYSLGYRSGSIGSSPDASLATSGQPTRSSNQVPLPPTAQEQVPSSSTTPHNMPLYMRMLMYFGIGRRASYARKALMSLIWNMFWGFSQIITIITMLILSGTFFRSTADPQRSEWTACDRPLGIWATLWVLRAILATFLAYWDFLRNRSLRFRIRTDTEAPNARRDPTTVHLGDTAVQNFRGTGSITNNHGNNNPNNNVQEHLPPPPRMYSRLTLLSSLMTLSWFLTAHILEYTSIHTCRQTSPHLWWLIFGILCIMYLMVLEVALLGLLVLVILPILFLFWNIFLICIGRHPIQNPGIKPEIGKLPKSFVERIPLVMYIPAPPQEGGVDAVENSHSYPPNMNLTPPLSPQPQRSHRRFIFFRNISELRRMKDDNKPKHGTDEGEKERGSTPGYQEPMSWEQNWVPGRYPFVRLEGNRASCAICLMDFEEPKRTKDIPGGGGNKENPSSSHSVNTPQAPPATAQHLSHEQINQLKLADAGDGAQPLRLLECGHVFHKTCLDPWLLDVSGRCPVCQRPVKVENSRKRHRRANG